MNKYFKRGFFASTVIFNLFWLAINLSQMAIESKYKVFVGFLITVVVGILFGYLSGNTDRRLRQEVEYIREESQNKIAI